MWPFARNKQTIRVPAVRCGDIIVHWNTELGWWEFSTGGIHYTLADNPVFDTSLLSDLGTVNDWLARLGPQIDAEIQKHLEGWCDWTGEKELVGIDVSWLMEKRQVDVGYAHEQWADLGINIVITNGEVTDSYCGD